MNEQRGEGCPPSSITGGIFTSGDRRADEIGLDWIQGSFPSENLYLVKNRLRLVGADFSPAMSGRNWYDCCEKAPNGTFVAFTNGRADAMFALTRQVCGQLDAIGQLTLLKDLSLLGVKFTRIDVRFDDYERLIEPAGIDAFVRARPKQVIHYREYRGVFPIDPATNALKGAGCYFGVRGRDGGGRQYCIYDKLLESGDESMDCIRWECRLYKERARIVGLYLCGSADVGQFVARLGEVVGGNIDFRERISDDPNLDRLPRPMWWSAILEKLGRVVIRPVRVIPKLRKTMDAIAHQYGSTFAAIRMSFEALGGNFFEFIDEVASDGLERMRQSHRDRVAEFIDEEVRAEKEVLCNQF